MIIALLPNSPLILMSSSTGSKTKLSALTLAALGVVFGDIGTSPLYTLKECFHHGHLTAEPQAIMGVLSLIFWLLFLGWRVVKNLRRRLLNIYDKTLFFMIKTPKIPSISY